VFAAQYPQNCRGKKHHEFVGAKCADFSDLVMEPYPELFSTDSAEMNAATQIELQREPEAGTLRAQGQGIGGPGASMARRRYQTGTLRLRGKKKKVWVLRWREDFTGPDGANRRVGHTTVLGSKAELTERLARRRADLLLSRINRPDYRPGKVIGFEEFSERWKEHALSQQKPSSQKVASSHLRFHLVKKFGRMRLDQIGQEDFQQFVSTIGKKLGRHTILNILGTLFSMLKTARQWGYIVSEIRQADLTIPTSRPSRPGRSFTAENVIAILEKAEDPWRVIFATAAMTGMRPGEVLGLSIDDLDFEARQIFVRRSAWYSQLLTPKTKGSESTVPMPAPLEAMLRAHLLGWTPNPSRLLFANRRNNPYSENKIVQKKLWPILDELKIPRCGMHAFRHSMASLLLSTGASAKVAQEQLRHADPMTTMRMYVHTVGKEQRDAVEKVAGIMRPNATKPEVNSSYVN
jgi:integrase